MSLRSTCYLWIGLIGLILAFSARPQLLALDEGNDLVNLTILYTGDEVGYLEPCG
jgi:hypothetical protein